MGTNDRFLEVQSKITSATKNRVRTLYLKDGAEMISDERRKVLKIRNVESDVELNKDFQLLRVVNALVYVDGEIPPLPIMLALKLFPNWDEEYLRDICSRPYSERLIIAGQLIAAEYDRVNYAV